MSTLVAQAPAQTRASRVLAFVGGFHLWMAFAISTLLIISLAGCALTGIELPGLGAWAIYCLVISAMVLPLPAYWYEKGRADLLDAASFGPFSLPPPCGGSARCASRLSWSREWSFFPP